MLQRVSKIQLSTLFSSTFGQGFSQVPSVLHQKNFQPKIPISQLQKQNFRLTQNKFSNLAINFAQQTDGKINVIVAPVNVNIKIKLSQILSAAFALGTGYTILTSFSYILTGAFALGTIATLRRVSQTKITRYMNRVLSIQIDQEKRIHIDYISGKKPYDYTTAIVDKKNFLYNAIRSELSSQNVIWIKANNDWFALPKQDLVINNQQFHNLL